MGMCSHMQTIDFGVIIPTVYTFSAVQTYSIGVSSYLLRDQNSTLKIYVANNSQPVKFALNKVIVP